MISYRTWQATAADARLLQQCKQAIRRAVADADVILYGSRARGDAREDSDYDILVLVDQPVNGALREKLVSSIYPLELDTGAVLTLATFNRRQWNSRPYRDMPLHKNIDREGVLL